jgi:hypothetical protein
MAINSVIRWPLSNPQVVGEHKLNLTPQVGAGHFGQFVRAGSTPPCSCCRRVRSSPRHQRPLEQSPRAIQTDLPVGVVSTMGALPIEAYESTFRHRSGCAVSQLVKPPGLNLEIVRECSVVSRKFEMCPRRGAKHCSVDNINPFHDAESLSPFLGGSNPCWAPKASGGSKRLPNRCVIPRMLLHSDGCARG